MSDKNLSYHEQLYIENTEKLREIIKTLPGYCKEYFRAIESRTSTKTRISYAYDIRVFYQFLITQNPYFANRTATSITLNELEHLEAVDIEEYVEYLKVYRNEQNGKMHKNDLRGIHRKLSALRSFYSYFNKRQLIKANPVILVDLPKLHEKNIIRLDYDEVAELLDIVEHRGSNLTGMKKIYYEKNRYRDIAIFTLLLGTGMRVSECVGIDIDNIDFKNTRIKIVRKGGKEDYVYYGEEVEEALSNYLEKSRNLITPASGHEKALFLTIQKKRISVKSIENLVADYAGELSTTKHITPHKLRSTFGTSLYKETGDIYLVAEVLGHNDVNTTKKHYAALDEDRKRSAAGAVRLREKRNKN